MTYIESIQDAIRRLHGCESRHVESVPVHEEFQGQTVWDGTVEVFELIDHPTAKVCYAWGHRTGDKNDRSRYVVVLNLPPVDSPVAAVRASIVGDMKSSSSPANAKRKADGETKTHQNDHRTNR